MSTGTEIIQDALKRIGAFSVAQPSDPGTIQDGLVMLNSMMQNWRSMGIFQDAVPLEVPGDELYEPIDARQAIVDNLAIMMAPNFDNGQTVVSESLRRNARMGFNDVETLYGTYEIPGKVPSSTLPKGSGNSKGNWAQPFFQPDAGDVLNG